MNALYMRAATLEARDVMRNSLPAWKHHDALVSLVGSAIETIDALKSGTNLSEDDLDELRGLSLFLEELARHEHDIVLKAFLDEA